MTEKSVLPRGVFPALKARDVMTSPVVFLKADENMRQAASALRKPGGSGAPVRAGQDQPVGVLTTSDIARYERDRVGTAEQGSHPGDPRTLGSMESVSRQSGFHVEDEEDMVGEWMTPKVFSVKTESSLSEVLEEMLRRRIHRVFVKTGKHGKLSGVITTFDLLRVLRSGLLSRARSGAAR